MPGETPPDIQPGMFGCTVAPAEGRSYLGMVTRDNHTWESVSQQLVSPLDSGVCYTFSVQLAASPAYFSHARLPAEPANYADPVVFRIWGAYESCNEDVLLAESPVIKHAEWRRYRFILRHLEDRPLTWLMLQAYYPPGKRCTPTMGNLLVDDLSGIIRTDCPTFQTDTVKNDYTVSLPLLESEADLNALLIRELASIRYSDRNAVRFEYQCAEDQLGKAILYGSHLAMAAEALKQFPAKKLVLRVKKGSKSTLNHRAAFLEKFLLACDLPEHRFEVRVNEDAPGEGEWKVSTSWLNARW